jgi:hypothetical protein
LSFSFIAGPSIISKKSPDEFDSTTALQRKYRYETRTFASREAGKRRMPAFGSFSPIQFKGNHTDKSKVMPDQPIRLQGGAKVRDRWNWRSLIHELGQVRSSECGIRSETMARFGFHRFEPFQERNK